MHECTHAHMIVLFSNTFQNQKANDIFENFPGGKRFQCYQDFTEEK